MGGAGFEPAKAMPSDLQSDPFDRSGNPPFKLRLGVGLATIDDEPSTNEFMY